MVSLIRSDLEFILQQILISEDHATREDAAGRPVAGTPLAGLVGSPVLSLGLRTVDGSYNNLLPGKHLWGTADQPMSRLTPPGYRNVDPVDLDGAGPLPPTQPTYRNIGNIADPSLRVISNLIVDNSSRNPAAAEAAGFDLAKGLDGVLGTDDDGQHVEDLVIPNVAPDLGLSAPFNSFMTLFGQFFDHGLDLVNKGGTGTVFVPLGQDDPLYDPGADGVAGTADDPQGQFMTLTRATRGPGADGVVGTADDTVTNQTTSFVDQNQTYTSHPSHQVLLREYVIDPATGRPVATGHLLEGASGGPATWGDVKAQASDLLGLNLTDADVTNLPLLATDEYGRFLRGPNGYVQLVTATGLVEGNPAANGGLGVNMPANVGRTGHAALDDIAHNANPNGRTGPLTPDADNAVGAIDAALVAGTYDDELLDAHFATGDGRGNENIGLTAVHAVFHAEHNRQVEEMKATVLASGDVAFLNEWLRVDVAAVPTTVDGIAALRWDGERMFQSARFATEMQYQHLVFEEFARKVAPQTDVFLTYDVTLNPSIVAEFANVVYRFGHSMLTESIDRLAPNFDADHIGLIEGFLNPIEFDNGGTVDVGIAAGAIVRGMTRQVGNEIDEFVTGALRNNLVGRPLDLATLNLARGRETGMPSLNEARSDFFAETHDSQLTPYTSWVDFAQNLKNEASVINFIAAYGKHQSILDATTAADKRAAAVALVTGDGFGGTQQERLDFLNAGGSWTAANSGLNGVDLWIGGLAEKTMPFGGMLGSTFAFVFENQMEALQSGDRFYYLARTAGLNFFNELEQNSFAEMIMKNTDARHLPSDVFSTPGYILEVDRTKQFNEGLGNADPNNGTPLNPEVVRTPTSIKYSGVEHVVLGGTAGNDTLTSSEGDDSLYGDGGNDRLEGRFGNDNLDGGAGDDIITDTGGDDVIKGNGGNDVIHGGNGLNLIIGGTGHDFIVTGEDSSETFAGQGNDFVYGAPANGPTTGNEGDDWIEIGTADGAAGDNADPFGQDLVVGHDVFLGDGGFDEFIGEGGDDILVGSLGINRNEGLSGYDWATYKDLASVRADLLLAAFDETPLPPNADTALDRFAEVEGLSGSQGRDFLMGDEETAATLPLAGQRGSVLTNIGLIEGLSTVLAGNTRVVGATTVFDGGNVILGGGGSDDITGRGGNDVIDGDKWLNVLIRAPDLVNGGTKLVSSMKALEADLFAGRINPSQLSIVRRIEKAAGTGDIDIAIYRFDASEYEVTANANGSFRVAHVGGTQADGVDTLWNVERVRFLDGEMALNVNTAAQGAPLLSDTTPTEGAALTASADELSDANGGINFATLTWEWEVSADGGLSWAAIAGATGASFTPLQTQVNQQLRVVARFQDVAGNAESRTSLVTAVVGDRFVGTAAIDTFNGTAGSDFADGGAGNDILNGLDGDDVLIAGTGNDTLNGGNGADRLTGGTGANRLNGGAGVDTMIGATGNDIYVVDDPLDVISGETGGTDTVEIVGTVINDYTLVAGLENLTYAGAASFIANGTTANNTLRTGTGNDLLDGRGGTDSMFGGGGSDVYFVDSSTDIVTEAAGAGNDTIEIRGAVTTYSVRANIEVYRYEGTSNITLNGNGQAQTLIGGEGNDTLNGLIGNDNLVGNSGNDALNGGDSNDRITGGVGDDALNGGSGNDTFVFAAGLGSDTITGFDANPTGGQDRLDIAAMGITAADFASTLTITASASGLDTVINFGSTTDQIILLGVTVAAVTQNDFLLA